MTETRYTIECNGQTVEHAEYPEAQWTNIAEASESRGGINARLIRHTKLARNAMTETIASAIVLDDMVICAPYIMAEVKG